MESEERETGPSQFVTLAFFAHAHHPSVFIIVTIMQVMRSKATAEQTSEIIRAEGRAKATAIIAAAEADRIRKLDEAMSSVSGVTAQRELIKAAGEVMSESKSSVVLANSVADVAALLGNGTGVVGTGIGLNKGGARRTNEGTAAS